MTSLGLLPLGSITIHPTKLIAEAYSCKLPPFFLLLVSLPINHCLVSPDIDGVKIDTGSDVGSDYRPLIIDLAIYPG